MRIVAAVACVSLLALPAVAWQESQPSLAEIARKDKERRAAAKPPKKVLTNEDLDNAKGRGVQILVDAPPASNAPAAENAPPPGAKAEKTETDKRADKQKEYQKQVADEVRMIGAIRKAMDDAQAELSSAGGGSFGPRRQSLVQLLEDGQKEIARREQAIADIQEKARREGISVSR